jgi:hypothetical protein
MPRSTAASILILRSFEYAFIVAASHVATQPFCKLLYELDAVLEGQDLCGEFGNNAGSGRLARQGDVLRLGGGESLASDAVESFDTAFPEVSGDSLLSCSPELRRALVVG